MSSGAPFDHSPGGPEHITRGEFQNVIGPLYTALAKLEASNETTREALGEMRVALQPLLDQSVDQKETKRDNKMALIGMLTGIASSIISGIAMIFLAGKSG